MANPRIKFKRGGYSNISSLTPQYGEPIYDLTNNNLYIGNGSDTVSSLIPIGGSSNGNNTYNIGEIIPSTIPLTDAGLHLLDGSLISGSGIYSDFVDYISGLYTTDPTASYFEQGGTETIYDYTGVGSITNSNGILSGFVGTTSYATISNPSPTTSLEIVIKCKKDTLSANADIINATANYGIVLRMVSTAGAISAFFSFTGSWSAAFATGITLSAGTWTYIKIVWDGTKYTFYQSSDGESWTTKNSYTSSSALTWSTGLLCLGGTSRESKPFTNGYIDLNGSYIKSDNTLFWEGSYNVTYTAEQMWQNEVNTNGVCDKFVCDTVNNTVRIPKLGSKIYTSSTTNPVDTYYYIVMANSVKTEIQVDIDEIVADLNDKMNTDLSNCTKPYIITTYSNGTTHYRIYSDGWCEQSWQASSPSTINTTLSLPIPFKDTSYTVIGSQADYSDLYICPITVYPATSSTFYALTSYNGTGYSLPCTWYACGYIH